MKGRFTALILALALTGSASAAPRGKAFASPEEAAKALARALQVGDKQAMLAIFGPDFNRLEAVDAAERLAARDSLRRLFGEGWSLTTTQDQHRVIRLGSEGWAFPVPLVKSGSVWQFDTDLGVEEIANRRVGRNELAALETIHLLVESQKEYHGKMGHYTTQLFSSPGQKNGLYWAAEGDAQSPLGQRLWDAPAFAQSRQKGAPWFGYYYSMTSTPTGFVLQAWPQQHGTTGVMSFWTNETGQIYEKDLGAHGGSFLRGLDATSNPQGWTVAPY